MFEISGRKFTIQVASDIVRNGIGVELCETTNGKSVFCCEIFRNDSKKLIEFSAAEIEIPFEAIELLKSTFESEIPKEFQD
ncbi:hypothetical protein SIO17_10825 [Pseudoalteromonas piscicida]|uniref:hypothetical protein n=1 Tax=Pseudoalteromonas piscicida TaxID=43662 RepID=UPI00026D12C9|nr:hypothetical protein [Pseudoalteromonas piscicida]WPU34158.1 hypothetical protein SIO17_10825 [Pseudoalteromonas piscicida]